MDIDKFILDVDEQVKGGLVDTETLFKTVAYLCHLTGVEARQNPQRYEYTLKQLEILSIVTPYLDDDYWKKKDDYMKTFKEKEQEYMKEKPTQAGLQSRFSNKFNDVENKSQDAYIQYLWEWHSLLLRKTKAKWQQQFKTHMLGKGETK